MLAALLTNLPQEEAPTGGNYVRHDVAHEKAERALKQLRKEYFERQKAERKKQIELEMEAAREIADAPSNVIKLPVLPPIEELYDEIEPEPATGLCGVADSADDILAVLFILAEV